MADPVSAAIAAVIKFGTEAILATGLVASQTTAAAIATFGVQAVGTAALSTAINAVLQPNVGAGGSPTQWQSDTDSGVPFVMGRRAVAGHAVHIDEWGPDNRYLSVVNVYSAAGPIKAFGAFYADETAVTFGGAYNKVSTGSYKDVMWMDRRLGAQPDTALASPSDPAVAGSLPGWTSAYKLSGKASSMWTLALDKERKRYPAGAPKPLQVIEGIYGYDPRLDSTYPGGSGSCRLNDRSTYVWIENPIIGCLNFDIGLWENGKCVGGLGEGDAPSLDGIDTDAYIACANVADANGWTLSAAWTSKDDPHQVRLAMLQAGGSKDCTVAGKLSCYSRGAPKTSVVTISAADTAGPIEISTAAPRIGRVNTIIPRCVLESHKWEMTPCDEVSVSAHVTTDRAKRSRGMDYPFVADAVQASQLAGLDIEDSREPITGRMPLKRYMQQVKPGDAFTITEPGFYLDGLKAIVVDREIDTANGIVTITFRSDTDAKYGFALGLDPTPPTYPGLTPPDPNAVAAASTDDWTATGTSVATGSGQTLVGHPALQVAGDFVNENVASAVIEYRKAADSAWIYHGEFASVADFETLIQPLSPDTLYDVSVRLRNIFGVLGDEADRLVIEDVQTPPFCTSDDSVNLGGVPAQTVFREIESIRAQQAASFASIETERLLRVTENEAFAQQVFTLRTDVDGNTAQIQTNFTTLSTSISANASAITSLDARVTTAEGDIVTNAAAISTEATARATEDAALAALITALEAEVDTNADGIADNAAAIVTEQTARADGDSALSSQITSLTATVGDNTAAITAEATARATADETLARRADTQEARLAGALAAIQVETETRATRDESFATRFYSVEAEVAGNAAAILVEQTARADGDSANASLITALTARVDTNEDDIADNAAAITTEATARADGDSALASQITTLEAEVDANAAAITTEQTARADGDSALASQITSLETEVDANAAAITNEATARATGDSANASAITALDARVTTNEGDIDANAANITTEQGVRATQTSAIAERLDRLSAQLAGIAAGLRIEAETRAEDGEALARFARTLEAGVSSNLARIITEETARASGDSALASQITTLESEVDANAAAITSEATTRANADSALATDITNLTATVGGNTASISTNAGAIATLEGATAYWELLAAAGGGDPAIFRLLAGEGGSEITLAASILGFWNTAGGGSLIKAMEIESGIVRILEELRLKNGAELTSYYDEGGGGEVKVLSIGQDGSGPFIRMKDPTDGTSVIEITPSGATVNGGRVATVQAAKLLTADANANYGVGSAGPETTIASVKLTGVSIPNVLTMHGSRLMPRTGANAADNVNVVVTWRLRAGTGPTTHVQTLDSGLVSYTTSGPLVIEQANDFYDSAVVNRIYTLDETLTGDVWINLTAQVTAASNDGDKAYFEGDNANAALRTQLSVAAVTGAAGAEAV